LPKWLLPILLAAFVIPAPETRAQSQVELELPLAVDVSSSVTADEYR